MVIVESGSIIFGTVGFLIFVFLLMVILCLIGCALKSESVKKSMLIISGILVSIGLIVTVLIIASNPLKEIHDNPVNTNVSIFNNEYISENVLKKEVSQATNSSKIVLEDRRDLFNHLHKGDFISFKALKNNEEISGNIYFTKTDMVIIINGDSEKFDKEIKVPTK